MNVKTLVIAVVALAIGAVAGNFLSLPTVETNVAMTNGDTEPGKKVLYWVAPMDPNFRRDGPGKSPMGMDLIPVYEGEETVGGNDDVAIRIGPNIVNNLGVRTASVERSDFSPHISTVGYIEFNEDSVSHVHLRTDGWIERLKVRSIGERVKKSDLLFELYSPTIVNAQAELLQALNSGRTSLVNAAEARLRALGVDDHQIKGLRRSGKSHRTIPIYAPQDGVVYQLNVGDGMYAQPSKTILSLADLSSVWVLADVFESDSHAIEPGLPASMTLAYLPGERWDGEIEYVYPTVDPKTRTLKVRLRFDNPGERLKPNMYADVTMHGRPSTNVISVPREALIRTGQSERVIVESGEGVFRPVLVKAGIESGDRVAILEGLSGGERVVVSGQFLIDSESSLSGALARLEASEPSDQTPSTEIRGKGVVNAVMPGERKLNVTHDPIAALGWPRMTMDFAVAPSVDLAAISGAQHVQFGLEKDEAGTWRIASIAPDGSNPSAKGIVHAVDAEARQVNMSHEPIPAIGWPKMTMDFKVAPSVDLSGISIGENYRFELGKNEASRWIITKFENNETDGGGS